MNNPIAELEMKLRFARMVTDDVHTYVLETEDRPVEEEEAMRAADRCLLLKDILEQMSEAVEALGSKHYMEVKAI